MAFGIGSSGFAQAGIELVVIRAAAAISQLRRFTTGLNLLKQGTIKAAIATERRSSAFRMAASFQQFAFAERSVQEQRAADRTEMATQRFVNAGQKEQDIIRSLMNFRLQKIRVMAEESDAYKKLDTFVQKEMLATRQSAIEQQQLALALSVVASVAVSFAAVLNGITGELIRVASETEAATFALEHLASASGLAYEGAKRVQRAIEDQLFTAKQAASGIGTLVTANLDYRHAAFLAALANDVAAARGLKAVQVYELLNRAVSVGTVTILRSLNIYRKTASVLEDYARAAGIVGRELTQQERSQAVLAFLYQESAKFAGAFSEAQETVAFQTKLVTKNVERLENGIGRHLLPIYIKSLKTINRLLATINSLSTETKKMLAEMLIVATVFAVVAGTVATLVPLIALLAASFKVLGGIAAVKGVLAISGIAAGLAGLWLRVKNQVEDVTESIEESADVVDSYTDFLGTAMMEERQLLEMEVDMMKVAIRELERGAKTLEANRADMTKEMERIADAMFELDVTKLGLDKVLHPLEDALFLFEAAARQTIIPIQRQERALQRVVDLLRESGEEEKKRRKEIIKALQKEVDAMKEKVALAAEGLEATTHEIFMEKLRNKILKKSISGRLLELRGEAAVERDNVARLRKELDALRKKFKDEKDRLESLESIAAKMLEAAEKQLKGVENNLAVHQEILKIRQEDLELAQLAQAEQRLAHKQAKRDRSEERFYLDRRFTLLRREETILKKQLERREKMVENLEEQIELLQEGLELPEPDLAAYEGLIDILDNVTGKFDVLEGVVKAFYDGLSALASDLGLIDELPEGSFPGLKLGRRIAEKIHEGIIKTLKDWAENKFPGQMEALVPVMAGSLAFVFGPASPFVARMVVGAFTLGQAIVKSIYLGITSGFDHTSDSTWDKMMQSIDKFFGVKSPAAKMVPVGESIMDGIIMGLEIGSKRMAARIPTIFAQARQVMANQAAWTANIGINELAMSGRGGPALVSGGIGMGGGTTSIVNNNYFSTPGATLNLTAHYANSQSISGIREDVELMMDLS